MIMKRILMLILCGILLFVCVACAPKVPDQGQQPSDTTPPEQGNEQGEPDGDGDSTQPSENKYGNYKKVTSRKIYVNYNDDRRNTVGASSLVFHGSGTDLTVLAYDLDSKQFAGSSSDVLGLINDGRIFKDIRSFTETDFTDSSKAYLINVKTTENAKIGELDTLRFTGSVTSTGGRVCYVYGYAFVMDNTPCVLAGLVLTAEQEASLIESITAEVEAMIKTVRSER